jgi:hypothetical protein
MSQITVTKGRLPRVEFQDEASSETLISVLQGWAVEVVTKKMSPSKGKTFQIEVQGWGEGDVLFGILLDEQYEFDIPMQDIKKIIVL